MKCEACEKMREALDRVWRIAKEEQTLEYYKATNPPAVLGTFAAIECISSAALALPCSCGEHVEYNHDNPAFASYDTEVKAYRDGKLAGEPVYPPEPAPTPRTDAESMRDSWGVEVVEAKFARKLERELAQQIEFAKGSLERAEKAERELAEVQQWKESQMLVAAKTQYHAVAKELGITLGMDIAENILPYIKKLKSELAAAERDEDIFRLNQMIRETGVGQGAIDAYVAQCETVDALTRDKERLLKFLEDAVERFDAQQLNDDSDREALQEYREAIAAARRCEG